MFFQFILLLTNNNFCWLCILLSKMVVLFTVNLSWKEITLKMFVLFETTIKTWVRLKHAHAKKCNYKFSEKLLPQQNLDRKSNCKTTCNCAFSCYFQTSQPFSLLIKKIMWKRNLFFNLPSNLSNKWNGKTF